jgi:heme/copper-type cytochrome/quinol oxidase subunit 4
MLSDNFIKQKRYKIVKFMKIGYILSNAIVVILIMYGISFVCSSFRESNVFLILGICFLSISLPIFITTSIFYFLFRKTPDDKQRHITLCVFGIIYGGIFVIIGSIIFLCNNYERYNNENDNHEVNNLVKLKHLHELYTSGAISKSEYEAKKIKYLQ